VPVAEHSTSPLVRNRFDDWPTHLPPTEPVVIMPDGIRQCADRVVPEAPYATLKIAEQACAARGCQKVCTRSDLVRAGYSSCTTGFLLCEDGDGCSDRHLQVCERPLCSRPKARALAWVRVPTGWC